MKQYLEYWLGLEGEGCIGNQGTHQRLTPIFWSLNTKYPQNFILLIILIAATLKLVEL